MTGAGVQESAVQRLLQLAAAVQSAVVAADERVTAPMLPAESADERAAVVLDLLQHDLVGVLLDGCEDAEAVEEFAQRVALLACAQREGLVWDLVPDLFGEGPAGGVLLPLAVCAAGGVR